MAMTMNGEYQLPVARETVWEKLNDAETLKACIPGCESLDKLSDTEFQAVAVTKIGPVKAKFKGKVTLSDLDPPNGYKISGQGDGGVAGFATGGATVKLEPKDGGTLLIYTVEAQIGGKLAQLGQRLVNVRGKEACQRFFPKICRYGQRAWRLAISFSIMIASTQFESSQPHHAFSCKQRFPSSRRLAPNWRGCLARFCLCNGVLEPSKPCLRLQCFGNRARQQAGAHRVDGLGPKAQLRNARRNRGSVRALSDL